MNLGDIPMNKPNSLKFHQRKDDLYRSMDLKTWDIRGAQTGQRPIDNNFAIRKRRDQVRNVMHVADIEGTVPKTTYDSLKAKGRHLNPLMPEYNYPGHRLLNEYGESAAHMSTPLSGAKKLPPIDLNPKSN